MKQTSFTGVILAGGASRRMGTDKAKLSSQNGESLLVIMKHLLRAAGAHNIVILGRPEEVGDIADKYPLKGPARTITDYLNSCQVSSLHLIVPIDMPNLTPALLQNLLATGGWANFSGYNMPFLAAATNVIPEHLVRVRDFLSYHNAAELTVPNEQEDAFLNLNHPHQFINWQHHQRLASSHSGTPEKGQTYV